MEYSMEHLIPIVAKLTEKYTSKESSSVTYETAQMLMEAAIYCLNEVYCDDHMVESNQLVAGETIDYVDVYNEGHQIVIKKVLKAKEIYDQIICDFDDYECSNYYATIVKGMPEFFLRYDTKFCPQNHLLTLDYPTLYMSNDKTGIDKILEYLIGINYEKKFLELFEHTYIVKLLEAIQIEYRQLYLDNICYAVLLQAIGCVIVEKPVSLLQLDEEDSKEITFYFEGDDINTIECKLRKIIELLTMNIQDEKLTAYFSKSTTLYAPLIRERVKNKTLHTIFVPLC